MFFFIPCTCVPHYEYDCLSWTGGNDVEVEGSYRWQHSIGKMNFTNWRSDGPSVSYGGRDEDCVQMMTNGYWNDGHCNENSAFICEIAYP
jgi:hypothetical protein